jgi:hypothetical protein
VTLANGALIARLPSLAVLCEVSDSSIWQANCSKPHRDKCGGQQGPSMKEGFMNPNSIEFIYKVINAIASGKYDPEIEQCLSDVIEEELLLFNANLALERRHEFMVLPPLGEAHIAAR